MSEKRKSFFDFICKQTDKEKLVRFAVDCAKRLTPADSVEGQSLLEVTENWLLNPSDDNFVAIWYSIMAVEQKPFDPTAPYNTALYAAKAARADSTESNSPGVYAGCVAYTVTSITTDGEREWQINRFNELFPETQFSL